MLRHVTRRFGGVTALNDISFEVRRGELLGVIGPNGAGKSTLLSLISGAQRVSEGEILFAGQRLDRLPAHAIARLGIGRAHQIPRPFGRMTVLQNVLIPVHARRNDSRSRGRFTEDAENILRLCGLFDRKDRQASSLALLDLKRLELARALALEPRLLLLDEVAAGLVGQEIEEITRLIASIHERGVTIILVEHVQAVVRALANRVIVLDWGRKIAEGTPEEIARHPDVIAVYLGSEQGEPTASAAPAARPGAAPTGAATTPADSESKSRPSLPSARAASTAAARPSPPPLLDVQHLSVDYGKLRALRSLDFQVGEGEIVAVVGANGAGKTTLTQAISGLVPVSEGRILFAGQEITRLPAHQRARLGIALCHEGRRLFREQTVRENLELGAAYAARGAITSFTERLERVYDLFPVLRERASSQAGRLSGGQQQMVAIGRALMAEPRLLLLDELSLGLAPAVVDQLFAALPRILAWGISVVLIEQHVQRSLAVADRVYVLERGRVVFCGTPDQVRAHPALQQAYLGMATSPASPSDLLPAGEQEQHPVSGG
uniref:ABC transporter domain-containing protein n=1 Tax=Thermogemmatispora argillosa TaxID=2045280 RepID=A0A455T1W4_9CHLR|nr:hypothetical protein KTA_14210 [Thermogemmatispora argillosa]